MRTFRSLVDLFFYLLLLMGILVLFPHLTSRKLEKVDLKMHRIAIAINNHPNFTKGKVEFYVTYNPLARFLYTAYTMPLIYPSSIFLTPSSIRNKNIRAYFDVIVAHELGHLQHPSGFRFWRHETSGESRADNFAVKLMGRDRVINFRLSLGYQQDHIFIRNLEEIQ